MYEYSFIPEQKNKYAQFLCILGFAIGLGFFYAANLFKPPFVYQTVGVCFLVVAIFMATRYVVKQYAYSTTDRGMAGYDLIINEIGGKKSTVVCRISVDEIIEFAPSERGVGRRLRRDKPFCYNYCPEIFPKDAYFIKASLPEGTALIKFCPDEKMVKILETLLGQNSFESKNES